MKTAFLAPVMNKVPRGPDVTAKIHATRGSLGRGTGATQVPDYQYGPQMSIPRIVRL